MCETYRRSAYKKFRTGNGIFKSFGPRPTETHERIILKVGVFGCHGGNAIFWSVCLTYLYTSVWPMYVFNYSQLLGQSPSVGYLIVNRRVRHGALVSWSETWWSADICGRFHGVDWRADVALATLGRHYSKVASTTAVVVWWLWNLVGRHMHVFAAHFGRQKTSSATCWCRTQSAEGAATRKPDRRQLYRGVICQRENESPTNRRSIGLNRKLRSGYLSVF